MSKFFKDYVWVFMVGDLAWLGLGVGFFKSDFGQKFPLPCVREGVSSRFSNEGGFMGWIWGDYSG